jgi:acyl carrier protein
MTEAIAADAKPVIRAYLIERFPGLAGRPLEDSSPLLASGAIDSLGVLDLMTFIEERFGIVVADQDFDPDNFETLGQLAAFVARARR